MFGYGTERELLGYIRLTEWCDGLGTGVSWEGWGSHAVSHIMERMWAIQEICLSRCNRCSSIAPLDAKYCPQCGNYMLDTKLEMYSEWRALATSSLDEYVKGEGGEVPTEEVFPTHGVYIYYHSIEGYKIGQAENVPRRLLKHECSAPSLELLHVIETSDLDWAEKFIHNKYARRRRASNHEYFDLTFGDLAWLFSVRVLEPPRTHDAQMSLLDLL